MRLYDDGVMMICIPQLFELVFIVDLLHFVGRDELGNKVNEGPKLARFGGGEERPINTNDTNMY